MYLTDGWHQVGRLYNPSEGGWLNIYYYSDSEFIMEVLNRWMVEDKYPQPEHTFKLCVASDPIVINDDNNDEDDNELGPMENGNNDDDEEEDDSQLDPIEDGHFYYSTETKLTARDVGISSIVRMNFDSTSWLIALKTFSFTIVRMNFETKLTARDCSHFQYHFVHWHCQGKQLDVF